MCQTCIVMYYEIHSVIGAPITRVTAHPSLSIHTRQAAVAASGTDISTPENLASGAAPRQSSSTKGVTRLKWCSSSLQKAPASGHCSLPCNLQVQAWIRPQSEARVCAGTPYLSQNPGCEYCRGSNARVMVRGIQCCWNRCQGLPQPRSKIGRKTTVCIGILGKPTVLLSRGNGLNGRLFTAWVSTLIGSDSECGCRSSANCEIPVDWWMSQHTPSFHCCSAIKGRVS